MNHYDGLFRLDEGTDLFSNSIYGTMILLTKLVVLFDSLFLLLIHLRCEGVNDVLKLLQSMEVKNTIHIKVFTHVRTTPIDGNSL